MIPVMVETLYSKEKDSINIDLLGVRNYLVKRRIKFIDLQVTLISSL